MSKEEFEQFLARHQLDAASFAEAVGVTRGAVTHWTQGRRAVPETVRRLTILFDETPDDLEWFKSLGEE